MRRKTVKREPTKPIIIDPLKPFGAEEWLKAGKPPRIVTPSTGTNHIDLKYFERFGVEVKCLLDDREALQEIRASSEFTFFLILAALRRAQKLFGAANRGEPAYELYKKKVGIIGLGRIGTNVAEWCRAFGCDVYVCDPHKGDEGIPPFLSLDALFAIADVVVCCCTSNDETREMVKASHLMTMNKNAVFVNTSRGEVVERGAIEQAASVRQDLTFAIDVHWGELDSSWIYRSYRRMPNVISTPHVAGHTYEAEEKAQEIAKRLRDDVN